ncbi:MAG: hypothetical protein L0229_01445 [Blastocatellia bacterium]|nr:hypothetical protein [Blastocatellia bacterium]
MPSVVAVFITTTEPFAEVVVVLALAHIIAVVAIVRVLIGVAVLIAVTPTVMAVCLSCAEALLITMVYGLTDQIRTVPIYLVIPAATIVTIARSRVEVRIAVVIVAVRILET